MISSNIEAEKAVLGSLIINNDVVAEINAILTSDAFYTPKHANIFKAILHLDNNQTPIDEITIGDQLTIDNNLETCGGYAYLAELVDSVPMSSTVEEYAKIVLENSISRKFTEIGKILSSSIDPKKKGRDSHATIKFLQDQITEISEKINFKDSCEPLGNILLRSMSRLQDLEASDKEIIGLETGFKEFDRYTSGLCPSDLIIIAARPAMGKTAFAMNLATQVAKKHSDKTVLVFNLEMGKEQLGNRIFSSEAKVDNERLKKPKKLDQRDWDNMSMSFNNISKIKILINDTPNLNILQLTAIARKQHKKDPLSLIVIDYLQLLSQVSRSGKREEEVSNMSRGLKLLAKELNIPIICLSQLNRSCEKRDDKRPRLSDLRESGSIEQDSDIVTFIYRDEVYNENSKDKGIAEVIFGKQRNGPTGTVKMAFKGEFTSFYNLSYQDENGIISP